MGRAAVRELHRIDRVAREERAGTRKLPTLEEVICKQTYSGERLPIEPFRAWLRSLIHLSGIEEGPGASGNLKRSHGRVADMLGVPNRRIYAWLNETEWMNYVTVDRAASRHGGTTPDQIYWDYGPKMRLYGHFVTYWWEPETAAAAAAARERKRRVATCHRQRCAEPVDAGGRFCTSCTADYARIRGELEGRTDAFRKTIGRKNARPTCCNPACRAPRSRGDRYCDDCQSEGWSEDDLE